MIPQELEETKKKVEVYQPESLLIHLKNKNQKKAFQALCEAFEIKPEFKKENTQEEESPYDAEFEPYLFTLI